jgi:hypothetical protein
MEFIYVDEIAAAADFWTISTRWYKNVGKQMTVQEALMRLASIRDNTEFGAPLKRSVIRLLDQIIRHQDDLATSIETTL